MSVVQKHIAVPSLDTLTSWLNPVDYRELLPLMTRATALAEPELELCAIANVGFGSCGEDCSFCAQNRTAPAIANFTLTLAEIVTSARLAKARGASRFSLVTSGGYCPTGVSFTHICKAITALREQVDILPCASLGILQGAQARQLAAAGLLRYHHNLETAQSFYASICSTHTWQERWQTNILAREAGLEICCGGILGLGESLSQRAELAQALGQLQPESIALNFYIPQQSANLTPLQALAACALFKLSSPASRLRLCGGREQHLAGLSPLAHLCGVSGIMVGDYLTTKGVDADRDRNEWAALQRKVLIPA